LGWGLAALVVPLAPRFQITTNERISMPADYYADAAPPAEAQQEQPQPQEQEKEEAGDSQTAEIPKNVLGGKDLKPGNKCEFEIVQVMEDSVLVKYASEGGEEASEAPPPAAAPQGGQMSSLME
jgi:hypothetical protein